MTRLIVTRLLTLIPTMFVITSIVFFMVRFVPGDPARIMIGGQRTTPQTLENVRKSYRLDKPLPTQYRLWVVDLLHGNLGRSFRQRQDVRKLIMDRLPITLQLATISFIISLLIAIPLGILAAMYRNSWIDVVATVFSLIGAS